MLMRGYRFLTGGVRQLKSPCKSVEYDRPNVEHAIQTAATDRAGSLAVVVCGPASLADDARAAFVAALRSGQGNMELFMEQFGW